ncbi:MAG TPA: hypothetical protein VFB24_04850 [Candidatus Binatia bacterium]|nr:hypothetical protein [Candidatus Binatia bacterium]
MLKLVQREELTEARQGGLELRFRMWGRKMDLVTVVVVLLVVVAYIVGSLTSSVETETELPHRYQ